MERIKKLLKKNVPPEIKDKLVTSNPPGKKAKSIFDELMCNEDCEELLATQPNPIHFQPR